ncbi:aldehyde dehydrogenase family protein [Mycetocola tolaasinivorans]|uniref:Aldehyde dehydrogenase family protein n=1 Tax=Mycetocola tolaasinivorans TaxID=76635 RepID=A0A3L7AE93_9MICO|nr:aldehyde dehydrogenase family protein [Mycetocola tolaasinivorans]
MPLLRPRDGSAGDAQIPATSAAEVAEHTCAAEAVFHSGVWSGLDPRERAAALLRLADLMERDADHLAALECADAGKPLRECVENDVPGAIESVRWFAEAVDKLTGQSFPAGPGVLALTEREPYGVVAAILPWNYPLAMAAWKIAPALAVGNSLVLKPADTTPRSVLHVEKLALEAGIPTGVLRVLPGTGAEAGEALARDPRIGALSFTGSTRTGRRILTAAAETNLKRVSLEMGGKSPQIIFADALVYGEDLISQTIESAFLTAGQNCTAGSRILVHTDIAEEFTRRFVAAASALVLGDPEDLDTDIGPVIGGGAATRMLAAVEEARAAGARVLLGGTEVPVVEGGHYVAPTVLDRVPAEARILREELFGPIVTIQTFTDEAEAIALANDTPYGLAASVWSAQIDRAIRVSRAVRAGVVSVNSYSEGDLTSPFGGWGESGFGGVEKSLRAFEQWTREKAIWVSLHG